MRPRLLVPLIIAASAGLLSFAHWFDFQCDDAFIAMRYAENWVAHGQIVYNVGERVEGYTSLSWVALLAFLHWFGLPLPMAAKLLGGTSAVLFVVCTAQYAKRLMPERPLGNVVLLAMVASNACVAAWTLGGLETPLFASLVVASIIAVWDWLDRSTSERASIRVAAGERFERTLEDRASISAVDVNCSARAIKCRALAAAAVLFVATLTRPEAGMLAICLGSSLGIIALRTRQLPRGTSAFVIGYAFACAGYLLWRHGYYGDWLPNTFYVKTSGAAGELRVRGLSYLGFCADELGLAFVLAFLVLAFLPERSSVEQTIGQRLASYTTRLYTLLTLAYVAMIGGDFLDLYRFLVPTFPLVFGLALHRAYALLECADGLHRATALPQGVRGLPRALTWFDGAERFPRARWFQLALSVAFLVWYGHNQVALAQRATLVSEVGRREHGIEPLGWTATYAKRWAATGRWLGAHSKAGDWLAVGAAGAMPFYSKLPNIDTFGLCDGYVARHGTVIGARPGHQRFAPIDYLLRRAPTFLLVNDYATSDPARFRQDPAWEQRGYVWIEAQITPAAHGAPSEFYHYFLVRKERAVTLVGAGMTRVAPQ